MLRKVLVASVGASIQIAAWQGLFAHAHLDDHFTEHHHGRLIHSHVAEHLHHVVPPGVLAIHDDDSDQTVSLQLFVAVAAASFAVPALPEHSFAANAALETAERRPPMAAHSHDPPAIGPLASRAPPADSSRLI